MKKILPVGLVLSLLLWGGLPSAQAQSPLKVNDQEYLDSQALDVLVHHTQYDQYFGDQKIQGIEFIHHGARTVTNGDVRLSNTPEQWDPVPVFNERTVDSTAHAPVVASPMIASLLML